MSSPTSVSAEDAGVSTESPSSSSAARTFLVTGDREWSNRPMTEQVLRSLWSLGYRRLVHGGARGADSMAASVWRLLTGNPDSAVEYPANWKEYHRAAGPILNQQMLDEEPTIELVVALHDRLEDSKGTRDMISRSQAAGKPVRHFSSQGEMNCCPHGVTWFNPCRSCKRSPRPRP
jgi:hypothetical protein